MSLTKEELMNNKLLEGLTPELADAVASVTATEEKKQINILTGTIYSALDDDFQSMFPDAERGNQKSYKFWPKVVADFKASKAELDTKIEELNTQLTEANDKIAAGITDESAKKEVEALKAKLETTKSEYEEKLTKASQRYEEEKKADLKDSVSREYDIVQERFKQSFKKDIPETIMKGHLSSLKSSFLEGYESTFDHELGRFVFSKDGSTVRDEKTQAPLTLEEIQKGFYGDLIDPELPGGGGGGKPPSEKHKGANGFDASKFATRQEAVEGLESYVTTELDLKPGTSEYQTKLDSIYSESIANMQPS